MTPRLREIYKNTIVPALIEEFNYQNPMQVPRLDKIVINMGVGEATQDRKKVDGAVSDMTLIAGQKPVSSRMRRTPSPALSCAMK